MKLKMNFKIIPLLLFFTIIFFVSGELFTVDTSRDLYASDDVDFLWMNSNRFYTVYYGENPSSGDVVKFIRGTDTMLLFPQELNYNNNLSDLQQISTPQPVSPVVSGPDITYPNVYGTDIDLKYQTEQSRVKEKLIIHNWSVMPDIQQYVLDGGDPVLELGFLFSNDERIFLDDVEWDRSSEIYTYNDIEVQDIDGNVLYWLNRPYAIDAAGATKQGRFLLKKSGQSLYIRMQIDYYWFNDTARVYPVIFDPTFTVDYSPIPAMLLWYGEVNSLNDSAFPNMTDISTGVSDNNDSTQYEVRSGIGGSSEFDYLIYSFDLDETSAPIDDASNNDLDSVIGGDSNLSVTGRDNSGVYFDGVNDYIQINQSSAMNVSAGGDFIVCMAMNTSTVSGGVMYDADYNVNDELTIELLSNGKVKATLARGGANVNVQSIFERNDGVWHNVCVLHDVSEDVLTLFVNALSVSNATITDSTALTIGSDIYIGNSLALNADYEGLLDELCLWAGNDLDLLSIKDDYVADGCPTSAALNASQGMAMTGKWNQTYDSEYDWFLRVKKTTDGTDDLTVIGYQSDDEPDTAQNNTKTLIGTGWFNVNVSSILDHEYTVEGLNFSMLRFWTTNSANFSEMLLRKEVNDTTVPNITNAAINDTTISCLESSKFSANVTDNLDVDTVTFTIEGVTYNATKNGDIFTYNLFPTANGTIVYDWNNISATDIVGNVNTTEPGTTVTYTCVYEDYINIQSVQAANITNQTANITWTTANISDSLVEYGTNSSNLSQSSYVATLITDHLVSLTGLLNNTLYYYQITSASGAITQTSIIYNFTTLANVVVDTTPPGDITNLLNISQDNQSIFVNWTNPADSDYNHSELYTNTTGSGLVFVANVTSPTTEYNITGLTNNTIYTIQIRPVDHLDNLGNYTTLTTTTYQNPAPPDTTPPADILNFLNVSQNNQSVYLNWSNPGDSDYNHSELYYNITGGGLTFVANVSQPTNDYNVTGLDANTIYTFQIRPVDTLDNLGNYSTVTTTTYANPDLVAPIITNTTSSPTLPLNNTGDEQNLSINFTSDEYPIDIYFILYNSTFGIADTQGPTTLTSANDLPIIYTIPDTLLDGTYELNFTVNDTSDNSNEYSVGLFTVEATGPVIVNCQANVTTLTCTEQAELSCNVTDGSGVNSVTFSLNNINYTASQSGDIWSYTLFPDINDTITYDWNLTTAIDGLANQASINPGVEINYSCVYEEYINITHTANVTTEDWFNLTSEEIVIYWSTDNPTNSSVNYGTELYSQATVGASEDFSDCSEWFDIFGSCGACSQGEYHSSCDDSSYVAATNSYYVDYTEFPITYSYDYTNDDDIGASLWISEVNGTRDFEYLFMRVQGDADRVIFQEGTGEAGPSCDYTFTKGQTYSLDFIMLSNWTMTAYVDGSYLCSYAFNNASAERILLTHYVALQSRSQNDSIDNLQITYGETSARQNTTSSSLATDHYISLTGLTPNTLYYYEITSAFNPSQTLTGFNFSTPPITGEIVVAADVYEVEINSTTNINTNSSITYDENQTYLFTNNDLTLSKTHSQTLISLLENITYYVNHTFCTNSGNCESQLYNFTTNPELPPGDITNFLNTSQNNVSVLLNWTNPSDADYDYAELYYNISGGSLISVANISSSLIVTPTYSLYDNLTTAEGITGNCESNGVDLFVCVHPGTSPYEYSIYNLTSKNMTLIDVANDTIWESWSGASPGDMSSCHYYNNNYYCMVGQGGTEYFGVVELSGDYTTYTKKAGTGDPDSTAGACDLYEGTDEIYCWADWDSTPANNNIWKYDIGDDNWTIVKNQLRPSSRMDGSSAKFKDDVLWFYSGGGGSTYHTNFTLYNVTSNTSTTIQNNGLDMYGLNGMATHCRWQRDILYCYGGINSSVLTEGGDMYYYDTNTNTYGWIDGAFDESYIGGKGSLGDKDYVFWGLDNTLGVNRYEVWEIDFTVLDTNSYNVTGLTNGTQYTFQIRPVDTSDKFGNFTTVTTTTYQNVAPITDVGGPNITLVSPADGAEDYSPIVFIYNVNDSNNIDNCELFLKGFFYRNDTNITSGITSNFTETLPPDIDYTWRVECYDEFGNKGISEERDLIIIEAPIGKSSGGGTTDEKTQEIPAPPPVEEPKEALPTASTIIRDRVVGQLQKIWDRIPIIRNLPLEQTILSLLIICSAWWIIYLAPAKRRKKKRIYA